MKTSLASLTLAAVVGFTAALATTSSADAQTPHRHQGYFSRRFDQRQGYGPYGYLLHEPARVDFFQRDYGPRVFHPYFYRRQFTAPQYYYYPQY